MRNVVDVGEEMTSRIKLNDCVNYVVNHSLVININLQSFVVYLAQQSLDTSVNGLPGSISESDSDNKKDQGLI